MPEVNISATPRTEFGKGPARRERRAGRVPGVLYGHGTASRHLSLPGHEVLLALRTPNVLIRLDGLAGGSQLALPKAVQRDPIRGTVEHVDLLLVRHGEKVTVDVPRQVTGGLAPDPQVGHQQIQKKVEAEAPPLPPAIEVDIEGMTVGTSVHAGDLKLPGGVTLAVDPELLVLHVIPAPTAAQMEADAGIEAPAAAEPTPESEASAPDAAAQSGE